MGNWLSEAEDAPEEAVAVLVREEAAHALTSLRKELRRLGAPGAPVRLLGGSLGQVLVPSFYGIGIDVIASELGDPVLRL
jgi:hypothetical protein